MKSCVEGRSGAVSCYAFVTPEAYQAAQPLGPGNFTTTCWAARWTRNRLGTVSGGINQFMPSDCPGSPSPEASGQADGSPTAVSTGQPIELRLALEHTLTGDNRILLEGTTNLPEGTQLSTSLSGGSFMGQDRAVVSGARWRSGPFGPRTGLQPRNYEASVTVPYGRTQPEIVQAQLGQQLEKLTGPLMETNPQLDFMGQSATVTATVTVK